MKHLFILFSLLISITSYSQSGEFKQYSNGLIYSENTMSKLSHIIDSLNLKFKSCDLNKTFYSKSQTIGHLITLENGQMEVLKKDIENGISFENFKIKYPKASIEENVLVVRFHYKNYDNKDMTNFSEVSLTGGYGFDIRKEGRLNKLKSKWLYKHQKKTKYSKESFEAFFFPNEFKSIPLGEKYTRMIGYADCLIDTTSSKFKKDMKSGWVDIPKDWNNLSEQKQKALLEKMRKTKVVGFCSQDSRPREHAINIAMLSAETTNWEVFLKAHLDIMNDRFERASDGSYAWEGRKTYIKELEKLDINVLDLILGISFRIENPAQNHYYGSINRIGRALSETMNQEAIEQALLSIIEDNNLDDYNRVLAYYLYDNYAYNFEDENLKSDKLNKLKQSVNMLPIYLSEKIQI